MTKSDIVKAAFQAWEPDAYKTMSLSVLASFLGVSKTALYRHFKNKDAIVEAMFASFFDDYFAKIMPAYENALKEKDEQKGLFILIRGITEFYVRNKSAFIFSLHRLNDPSQNIGQQMQQRGINILKLPYLQSLEKNTLFLQTSVSIAIYMTAFFFLSENHNLSEDDIQNVLDRTEHQIAYGLGFNTEELNSINYDELDEIISQSLSSGAGKYNNVLKAVANAIAEAGSGEASMELVAKHAGLSKSGLYSHFKNKEDMLRQFFTIEFGKIYDDLVAIPKTEKPAEQLYLLCASTIRYLQARPEIMVALDWIRTQRLDLCLALTKTVIERSSDNRFVKKCPKSDLQLPLAELPHFILFCIIRLLKNNYFLGKEIQLSTENIRFLYIFLISGIKR